MQTVLKISLLLLSALSFGVSFTPPHSLPTFSEDKKPLRGIREWIVVFRIKYVLPLQRAAYYVAILNECFCLMTFINTTPNPTNTSITPAFILSVLSLFFGGFIRLSCYRELGECFTFELVPAGQHAKNPVTANNPKLITTGPYNYVRHPSYLGSWLSFFGSISTLLVGGSWIRESGFLDTALGRISVGSWIFAVGQGAVLVTMRICDEDELMKKQFGEQWDRWSKVVKYRMIPGVF